MKYEYKTEQWPSGPPVARPVYPYEGLEGQLNLWGREGWEVMTVVLDTGVTARSPQDQAPRFLIAMRRESK